MPARRKRWTLGWTGLFEGPPYGIGMLAAGIILSIMIIPIKHLLLKLCVKDGKRYVFQLI